MTQTQNRTERFIRELTSAQNRLYAYCLSLMGDREQAEEVLQEANVVIWRKAEEFELGTNFSAWALRICHFQAQAYRKRQLRERLVLDDALLDQMAGECEQEPLNDDRYEALEECLEELPTGHRHLVNMRYILGTSAKLIAEQSGKSPNAVSQMLHRIRVILVECIQRKLTEQGGR